MSTVADAGVSTVIETFGVRGDALSSIAKVWDLDG
jgi:DNA mismatch repair ATPase MutL